MILDFIHDIVFPVVAMAALILLLLLGGEQFINWVEERQAINCELSGKHMNRVTMYVKNVGCLTHMKDDTWLPLHQLRGQD